MSITRGDFLRSLGKSLPGLVASTGVATAAEALIRRVAQAAPDPAVPDVSPPADVPFFEHGSTEGNRIALTFDDGPVPGVTELILDELKKRELRATFFFIGRHVAAAPELARRVAEEGHEIGNHTFTHRKLTELADQEVANELDQTTKILSSIVTHPVAWLRPPFGALRKNQGALAASRGLGIALWNVDSGDWRQPATGTILHNVLTQVNAGSIILCHEVPPTAACLGELLEELRKKKYALVTLSELVSIPAA